MAELHDESSARRARALPTRDDLVKPTLTLYERRKAEEQERIEAHRRQQAVDLLTRSLGRVPSEAEIAVALKR